MVILIEKFNKLEPSTIPMAKFHFHISDESDQDASTSAMHIRILNQLLLTKGFIAQFLPTMWDRADGCAKHYQHAYVIYILIFLL